MRPGGAYDIAGGGAPVCSDNDGRVTFNHLQQREPEDTEDGRCPPDNHRPLGNRRRGA